MKIVHIIPDLSIGGAQIMMMNLALFQHKSHEVHVVSYYSFDNFILHELTKCGITVHQLDKKVSLDIFLFCKIYKVLKAITPDVIHSHLHAMQYAFPYLFLNKVRSIHTVHNIATKELPKRVQLIQKLLYKLKFTTPVAISPIVQSSIITKYHFNDTNVPIIYNGINFSKYQSTTSKKEYLLHIGRFEEQKNHIMLVEAFSIIHQALPKMNLVMIGEGPLKENIKMKVKEYQLSDVVHFEPITSEIYLYLNKAKLFLLTSLWEGTPVTIVEALIMGVPVISTDVGGVSDLIIDSQNGHLTDLNPGSFADKCIKCLVDINHYNELVNGTRINLERFNQENMGAEYNYLYNLGRKA